MLWHFFISTRINYSSARITFFQSSTISLLSFYCNVNIIYAVICDSYGWRETEIHSVCFDHKTQSIGYKMSKIRTYWYANTHAKA